MKKAGRIYRLLSTYGSKEVLVFPNEFKRAGDKVDAKLDLTWPQGVDQKISMQPMNVLFPLPMRMDARYLSQCWIRLN